MPPQPPVVHEEMEITVRYWAGARAASGVAEEQVRLPPDSCVGDVITWATTRHQALSRVMPSCSLLVDGLRVSAQDPVRAGIVLEVLPPFAGG